MLQLRKSGERGHLNHGWLDTYHSFSFGDYYDPKNMGFRDLRVINEDIVQASQGFGTHGHRDMEIITYVVKGALEHRDSMGNGSVITPGDVQYMSAGSGVRHSEFNHSPTEDVHLLQIWILPNATGLSPRYDQKRFEPESRQDRFCLMASGDGAEGSIAIRQDVRLYGALLAAGKSLRHNLGKGRAAYLQLVKGEVTVGQHKLTPGDALVAENEATLEITASAPAELLLFDLA